MFTGIVEEIGEIVEVGTSADAARLRIAGPLVLVLFLADVGLGLVTRVAPALNAFALGFPLKIMLTLVLAGLGLERLRTVGHVGRVAHHEVHQPFPVDELLPRIAHPEVDGHPDDPGLKNALEELAFFTTEVKVLGVYPADPFRLT